jgi:hypothetical protein
MVPPESNVASRPRSKAVMVCNVWVSENVEELRGSKQGFRMLGPEDGYIKLPRKILLKRM